MRPIHKVLIEGWPRALCGAGNPHRRSLMEYTLKDAEVTCRKCKKQLKKVERNCSRFDFL